MREKKEQRTSWRVCGYENVREAKYKLPAAETVEPGEGFEAALAMLEHYMGFDAPEVSVVEVGTPVGVVRIERGMLGHIVEKRADARERYVNYALATMREPLEVWRTAYEDDEGAEAYRQAYIGAFEGKHQMLVVCAEIGGKVLWNFMQCESKSLNKHRHGTECIYRRL